VPKVQKLNPPNISIYYLRAAAPPPPSPPIPIIKPNQ